MHNIQRLELELKTADRDRAQAHMERVSALYHARLSRVVERVFDGLSPADQRHRIPRLEIDLGVIGAEAFEAEFLPRFERELRAALGRSLWRWEVRSPTAQQVQDGLELIETFGWTGNVPAWAVVTEPDLVEKHMLQVAERAPRALLTLLVRLQRVPTALTRLARHLSDPALSALSAHVAPHAGTPSPQQQAEFTGVAGEALERRTRVLRWMVKGHLIQHSDVHPADVAAGRRAPGQAEPGAPAVSAEAPGQPIAAEPAPEPEPPADVATGRRAPGQAEPGAPAVSAEAPGQPIAAEPAPDHAAQPSPLRSKPRHLSQLSELYTAQAGLVLLWPFLERFFARLDLLSEERHFVDAAAQSRAVALLGYLVTQQAHPPEYQSALAKVLCGLNPTAELHETAEPTPAERVECERLLQAVVDHAVDGQAHSLTPADFRIGFLARQGLLSAGRDALCLRVERDETLDHAMALWRWTWAFVKLPFMPQPLQVEW